MKKRKNVFKKIHRFKITATRHHHRTNWKKWVNQKKICFVLILKAKRKKKNIHIESANAIASMCNNNSDTSNEKN